MHKSPSLSLHTCPCSRLPRGIFSRVRPQPPGGAGAGYGLLRIFQDGGQRYLEFYFYAIFTPKVCSFRGTTHFGIIIARENRFSGLVSRLVKLKGLRKKTWENAELVHVTLMGETPVILQVPTYACGVSPQHNQLCRISNFSSPIDLKCDLNNSWSSTELRCDRICCLTLDFRMVLCCTIITIHQITIGYCCDKH